MEAIYTSKAVFGIIAHVIRVIRNGIFLFFLFPLFMTMMQRVNLLCLLLYCPGYRHIYMMNFLRAKVYYSMTYHG